MIVLVVAVLGLAAGERTVLVTPRPRWYQPTRFAHEPRQDPSSPLVPPFRRPVISLRIVHPLPNSLISAKLPVEHRQHAGDSRKKLHQQRLKFQQQPQQQKYPLQAQQPSLSERPIVVMPAGTPPPPVSTLPTTAAPQHLDPEEHVFVESLPSVSVQLTQDKLAEDEGPSLPDYLTPPKFPSIYEKQFTDTKQTNAPQPSKKKKKTKKRKQKIDSRERDGENRSRSPPSSLNKIKPQSSGERVEFQLHGQNGPDSYKFGFDTGAGKNRQFRFEEKDANGNVKGHFGYYDTTGKLQMVNYRADETGFHAEQVD